MSDHCIDPWTPTLPVAGPRRALPLLVARVTGRAGRGAGLVLGYGIGVLGALVVTAAAMRGSFPVMLTGSLLLGGANAAIFLSRYAAADIGGRTRAGGRWGPSCSRPRSARSPARCCWSRPPAGPGARASPAGRPLPDRGGRLRGGQ